MENESRIRRHRTAAERAQVLAEYHQSGLTQGAFAAQAGISCSALSSWLRRAATNSDGNKPQFVSVPNLLSSGRGSAAYRLQWSDGFAVEVSAGFAAQELSALLKTIQRL